MNVLFVSRESLRTQTQRKTQIMTFKLKVTKGEFSSVMLH